MFGFKKLEEHAELVTRMSEALGIDFAEEMQAGRMTPDELRTTVLRCVACAEAGECKHFLDAHPAGTAEHTPNFCRNKSVLEAMRPE